MKKKGGTGVVVGELPELGHKSREIDEARKLIAKAALPTTHAAVANYARLAFRAIAKRTPKSDESLGVSASKWGGAPDLPAEVEVPALALVAQINLARLPTQALAHAGVPTGGLLSFFYDIERAPSGLSPEHIGCSVLYTPSSASFVRRPAGQAKGLRPCELAVRPELTIPPIESSDYQAVCDGKDVDGGLAYARLVSSVAALAGAGTVTHRFLGHPTPVQGNLQLACEVVSRGLDAGAPKSFEGLGTDVLAKSRRWRLLLQVDSAPEIESSWGDAGRLYFLVPEEDLREMRFDRVRAIQQGH